jgi:hypothetical protein
MNEYVLVGSRCWEAGATAGAVESVLLFGGARRRSRKDGVWKGAI